MRWVTRRCDVDSEPEVLKSKRQGFFDDVVATMDRKARSYARPGDPYGNYVKAAFVCGMSPAEGVVVRLAEKTARVAELLHSGTVPADGEALEDTLKDIAAFAVLIKELVDEES
jgi:hypothetical protein